MKALKEAFIQQYLVPWLELDWPVYWDALFEQAGPLAIEIGFGNGAFLVNQARRYSHINFVGIDRSWESVRRLCRLLEETCLRNIRVLHVDATFAIGQLFETGVVNQALINFPDPWPKKRHHGRRLIQPKFVDELARCLALEGEVTIVTDHFGYATWIASVLEGQATLLPRSGSSWVHQLEGRTSTKYEQRGKAAGAKIYYFPWRRSRTELPGSQTERNASTLASKIRAGADPECLLGNFRPPSWQATHLGVPVVGKVLGVYTHTDSVRRLIEMRIQEGNLIQNLGLVVQVKPGGVILVEPAALGYSRLSWGVKQAVHRIARAIEKCSQRLHSDREMYQQ